MTQQPTDPHYGSPLSVPSFQPAAPQYPAQSVPSQVPLSSYAPPQDPAYGYVPPAPAPTVASPYGASYADATPVAGAGYGEPIVKKSPVLGIIGLAIVVIAAVVYYMACKNLYDGIFTLLGPAIMSGGATAINELTPEQMAQFAGPGTTIILASVVGLAGFIVSIVAAVKNSGRPMAVTGIVLGVLAPFLIIVAAAVSYSSYG